jgi:hypothetical protein
MPAKIPQTPNFKVFSGFLLARGDAEMIRCSGESFSNFCEGSPWGKRGGELEIVAVDTAPMPEIVRHSQSSSMLVLIVIRDTDTVQDGITRGMESYPVNSRVRHRSIQCNPIQENKEKSPLVHSETITLTFPQFPKCHLQILVVRYIQRCMWWIRLNARPPSLYPPSSSLDWLTRWG